MKTQPQEMLPFPAFRANLCNDLTSPECNKLVGFHTGPVDSWSDWLMQFADEEQEEKRSSCSSNMVAFFFNRKWKGLCSCLG